MACMIGTNSWVVSSSDACETLRLLLELALDDDTVGESTSGRGGPTPPGICSGGWKGRCLNVLPLYRLVFSKRFFRLCSDITCDRMRFNVSSFVPADAVSESVLTQNKVDFPDVLAALRGLRTLEVALWSLVVFVAGPGSVLEIGAGAGAAGCVVEIVVGSSVAVRVAGWGATV